MEFKRVFAKAGVMRPDYTIYTAKSLRDLAASDPVRFEFNEASGELWIKVQEQQNLTSQPSFSVRAVNNSFEN
jgi:hypothetical protein